MTDVLRLSDMAATMNKIWQAEHYKLVQRWEDELPENILRRRGHVRWNEQDVQASRPRRIQIGTTLRVRLPTNFMVTR